MHTCPNTQPQSHMPIVNDKAVADGAEEDCDKTRKLSACLTHALVVKKVAFCSRLLAKKQRSPRFTLTANEKVNDGALCLPTRVFGHLDHVVPCGVVPDLHLGALAQEEDGDLVMEAMRLLNGAVKRRAQFTVLKMNVGVVANQQFYHHGSPHVACPVQGLMSVRVLRVNGCAICNERLTRVQLPILHSLHEGSVPLTVGRVDLRANANQTHGEARVPPQSGPVQRTDSLVVLRLDVDVDLLFEQHVYDLSVAFQACVVQEVVSQSVHIAEREPFHDRGLHVSVP